MSVVIKNVYLAQVPAADTLLYTAPVLTQARVLKCTVTNDTTTVTTLSVHAGAAGDGTLILNERPIGSKETYECPEVVGQVVNASGVLRAEAGVATQLTLKVDVVEIS